MPLNLRPWQLLALPHLEWLLDEGPRATGRTTTMAIAMIRLAARHPRRPISFIDHCPTQRMSEHMRDVVMSLASEDPRLSPYLACRGMGFRINLPEALVNWLPLATTEEHQVFDVYPPARSVIPVPEVIGGFYSDSARLTLGNPTLINNIARSRGLSVEALEAEAQESRRFWDDSIDALRYAQLGVLNQVKPVDPPQPEEPGPSILDRILADNWAF